MKRFSALGCFLTLVLAGCHSTPHPHSNDPFESANRSIFKFNEKIDKAVLKPVAKAYVKVVPVPVRTGVHNVLSNVDDSWSFLNSLLQGKREAAGKSVGRVLVNSFFGIGGIIDVASEAGIEKQDEDLGQTLAVWGVPQGPYLVIPFIGPSTIRDGVGQIGWLVVNPLSQGSDTLAYTSLGLRVIDTRTELLDSDPILNDLSMDSYTFVRSAYWQHRAYQIRDGQPEPLDDSSNDLDNNTASASNKNNVNSPAKSSTTTLGSPITPESSIDSKTVLPEQGK